MTVDISPLSSMTTIDDRVKQMVLAMPDFSVGDQVHAIYVNRMSGATPGQSSAPFGQTFLNIFFPGWQPAAYEGAVNQYTGTDDKWWADLATATLCQTMLVITHDLQPQLLPVPINAIVSTYNANLNNQTTPFYSYVFSQSFSDFSIPFAAMDHPTALAQYKQVLLGSINIHAIWYADGLWKNPEWEMYHHYIKLMALGMAESDIDQLIGQLQAAGLPIPANMVPGVWQKFSGYLFNKTSIDYTDIKSAASDGILRSEVIWGGSSMAEANSFEFTADGQPGNMYRTTASNGSCFTGNTRVLMRDGLLKRIDQVQPGDWVASPNGPRKVVLVSTPDRSGRALYSFNNLSFRFTGSHPFLHGAQAGLSGAEQPRLLCVEPGQLRRWVPFLGKDGTGHLAPGAALLQANPAAPAETTPAVVHTVAQHPPDGEDALLYDVILQPDPSGTFEYIAGDENNLFVVASEIPPLLRSPYATRAVIGLLDAALPALQQQFAALDRPAFTQLLDRLSRHISGSLMHQTLLHLPSIQAGLAPDPQPGIDELVSGVMDAFKTEEQGYNWMAGQAYEMLASRLAEEAEAAVELGWRVMPRVEGERLALSLADLHLEPGHGIVSGEQLRLVVRLAVDGKPEEERMVVDAGAAGSTPFARRFDRVIYFDTMKARARAGKQLDFSLYSERSDVPLLTGSAHLPHRLHLPYRRFSARLFPAGGAASGHLFFDIRLLSVKEIEQEQAQHSLWAASDRETFAGRLGAQMGRELVHLIASMAPDGSLQMTAPQDETPDVKVTAFMRNPAGVDLVGEYVALQNQSAFAANLTNWTLSDVQGHTYTFPAFMLPAGETVKVWTTAGANEPQNLFWGRKKAVWNNKGDTVFLRDAGGRVVDSRS
jgi:hypothetical protein